MFLHSNITEVIIETYYEVYNTLGFGFLEKVYENAMSIELKNKGLHVLKQEKIDVFYKNIKVGEYFADLIIEGEVIVELKQLNHFAKKMSDN